MTTQKQRTILAESMIGNEQANVFRIGVRASIAIIVGYVVHDLLRSMTLLTTSLIWGLTSVVLFVTYLIVQKCFDDYLFGRRSRISLMWMAFVFIFGAESVTKFFHVSARLPEWNNVVFYRRFDLKFFRPKGFTVVKSNNELINDLLWIAQRNNDRAYFGVWRPDEYSREMLLAKILVDLHTGSRAVVDLAHEQRSIGAVVTYQLNDAKDGYVHVIEFKHEGLQCIYAERTFTKTASGIFLNSVDKER